MAANQAKAADHGHQKRKLYKLSAGVCAAGLSTSKWRRVFQRKGLHPRPNLVLLLPSTILFRHCVFAVPSVHSIETRSQASINCYSPRADRTGHGQRTSRRSPSPVPWRQRSRSLPSPPPPRRLRRPRLPRGSYFLRACSPAALEDNLSSCRPRPCLFVECALEVSPGGVVVSSTKSRGLRPLTCLAFGAAASRRVSRREDVKTRRRKETIAGHQK